MLLIKLLSLIHLCHLRLYTRVNTIMEIWFKVLEIHQHMGEPWNYFCFNEPVCNSTRYFWFWGFVHSRKTWKSRGILKWLFSGLEKTLKKIKSQKFWKSPGRLLYSSVHLRSLIKRINVYVCIYIYIYICMLLIKLLFLIHLNSRIHRDFSMFGHGNLV